MPSTLGKEKKMSLLNKGDDKVGGYFFPQRQI